MNLRRAQQKQKQMTATCHIYQYVMLKALYIIKSHKSASAIETPEYTGYSRMDRYSDRTTTVYAVLLL